MNNNAVVSNPLTRSNAESLGIPSSAIAQFLDAVAADEGLGLHSFMLLRHGQVAAEGWWKPYAPELPHILYSLTKSFMSTATGFAVSEGLFSLDDKVVSFFPDDLPENVDDNLAAMRVRDLLAMATGNVTEPAMYSDPDGNWARAFLAHPVEKEPGTHFLYNSAASYMAGAIVTKTSGMDLIDYLDERLFTPLGIARPLWDRCPKGIRIGGWGMSVRTEDIAKFGQLYLNDGVWNGKRILPEGWVKTATSKHVSNGSDPNNDWNQGYGFQFWRCKNNAFRGDGAFGQYCIVMPDQDAVVAITSYVNSMQKVLDLVWQNLLPAMSNESLPENPEAYGKLTEQLGSLEFEPQQGHDNPEAAEMVSGRTYQFESNPFDFKTVCLDVNADGSGTALFEVDEETHRIEFGRNEWKSGTVRFGKVRIGAQPTSSTGAWTGSQTLSLKTCLVQTPFLMKLVFEFEADRLSLDIFGTLDFGQTERPTLQAKAIE